MSLFGKDLALVSFMLETRSFGKAIEAAGKELNNDLIWSNSKNLEIAIFLSIPEKIIDILTKL